MSNIKFRSNLDTGLRNSFLEVTVVSAKRAGSYNVATRGNLLDAAEHLFAERGYEAVTLKEIAEVASANVGQIVYHFGQKDELIKEVVLRRAGLISDERLQLLDSYERLVGLNKVELEPVVRAFLDPYFAKLKSDDPGWRCYALFIGRNVWDAKLSQAISEGFNPTAHRYIEAIRRAVPTLTKVDGARAFQFLLAGLYGSTTNDSRINGLLGDDSLSADYDGYQEILIPYVVGGIKSIGDMRAAAAWA
ncbi:TetR/AcrR family transcriptional regulator [Actibacterium sp. XHP0104]|uniref:TetR/AcrR family transcriptional regulator n=1 Tax=Actibacterium sp. XHP0104 TaxID=2984335 RepID=UPI0021E86EA4|nr:TetR family transcriptional regulator [Actibacterium sp. XHP0104]MCV2882990.1 TetR family transcriptional regulator [Actibacterium sp. XHP0104]